MAKEKSAVDLSQLIAAQIDAVTSTEVDAFTLKKAEAVANMVGKLTKLAALRMSYQDYKSKGGEVIQTLESK
jgi:hypothetical protein